jgi:hypothetical protein
MEKLNDPDQWHAIMTGSAGTPDQVREIFYGQSPLTAYTTVQAATLPAGKANNTWRVTSG